MRFILTIALTCVAMAASAEVYRWVDDDGVVHYTDRPPDGAKARPAELPPLQRLDSVDTTGKASSRPSKPAKQSANTSGLAVKVTSPSPDEVIRSAAHTVTIAASVSPKLPPRYGLVYFVDGKPITASPTRASSMTATEVYRGAHTASVAIIGPDGSQTDSSGTVRFHMKPPTAQNPRGSATRP